MKKNMWGAGETEFFHQLNPDNVLNSVEKLGLRTTGRCLPLNSMENRVYEIELELDHEPENPSEKFCVAKFYRPGRWSFQQIQEEHDFLWDLLDHELPVVAPLKFNGKTLFETKQGNLKYTVFPKKGGRNLDEINDEQMEMLGRLMGRMHNIGKTKKAEHRLKISIENYGESNLQYTLTTDKIPLHFAKEYEKVCLEIFEISRPLFKDIHYQRIHGDCHWGNIIWDQSLGPFFVDFDDMVRGPVVQDIWLTLPGRDQETKQRRDIFLEAYEEWSDFNRRELKLIETLRALRFIHFTAWIGKRWEDPSFKQAFPQYQDQHYWQVQINDLKEQLLYIKKDLEDDPLLF